MVFLTTSKSIQSVFTANPSGEDEIVVFFKDGDSVKMSDVQELLKYKVSLIPVDDRDDMLIFLGGWFVTNDGLVTVVDSTIPIPKRYGDRISEVKAKAAPKRRTPRKTVKKSAEESPASVVKTENTAVTEHDISGAMNPSEEPVKEVIADDKKKVDSLVPHEETPVFDDENAKRLYEMIGVKSEDIGFHWNTNMLMLTLLTDIAQCETDADVRTFLAASYESHGDFLWNRIEPHLSEIRLLSE